MIGSYLAFKKFFHKERERKESKYIEQFSCMSFYNTFLDLDEKLEEKQEGTEDQANKKEQKEKKEINPLIGKSWYSGLATLFFVWLYEKNSRVKEKIEIIEKKCDNFLSFLETQNIDLTDLRIEKKKIFTFNLRRPFFFYVSHQLFGNILRKCHLFYEKLKALN